MIQQQQKNGKGGKRPNAGRKKMAQPKVKIFLNIPPLLKKYLTLTNTNAGTLTRYLLEKYFDDVLKIDISCWQDKPTNFINVNGRWIFEDWKKDGKKYINPNIPPNCIIKKTNRKPGKYQTTSIINTYIYKRMVLYCKKNNIKLTKLMPELLFNYFEKNGIHKSCWLKTNTTNKLKLKTYTLNNNNILFFDDDFIIGKIGSKEIIIAPVHDI